MSYVIRVIGPSGMTRYLTKDRRTVEFSKDAFHFSDAVVAQVVADAYLDVARKCAHFPPLVVVTDLESP